MEKYEIDDLLKQVSPELLVGYENKNPSEEGTLAEVNEKYKFALNRRGSLGVAWVSGFFCLALVIAVVLIISPDNQLLAHIGQGLIFGVLFLAVFVELGPISKKRSDLLELQWRCESILDNFRQSVEGLDPTWRSPDDRYNKSSVRETLIGFAVRLLDAENKFKKERMLEDAATYSVLHYGNWEVKCRDELENMLRAVEKFGLTFSKTELFRDAKKHLERVA